MRLIKVRMENYRSFREETDVSIGELTTLIGKNDAGKSSILEALDAVLASGKIDASDVCVNSNDGELMSVRCFFNLLPVTLTLDAGSTTTLQDEFLLDRDGQLCVRWSWKIKVVEQKVTIPSKPKIELIANHPTASGAKNLHAKKNTDLKTKVRELMIQQDCELNNNASMRQAIWHHIGTNGGLSLEDSIIDMSKEDGKSIWEQIQKEIPLFVLFRSDRPSTDEDSEVQDPLKVAIKQALAELQSEIDAIKQLVREKSLKVARRTLNKLRDFDPDLASTLDPTFKSEPKWDGIFKISLSADDDIPLNKRGSGVRRLVLFSFFRAEAERRREENSKGNIIYAVEEPETSQHPNHQKMVVEALRDIAGLDGSQVILTTHVPGLGGLLPVESLRLVDRGTGTTQVIEGSDGVYERIVHTLGVVPDKRAQVLVCVEGPNDAIFIRKMSTLLLSAGHAVPNIDSDPRIATVLLGGSTLQEWVNKHYLQPTGIPEFHIYDRDMARADGTYKYQEACDEVNAREGGHSARLTEKREMENYLHPDAIDRILSPVVGNEVKPSIGDDDDVEDLVSNCILDNNGNPQRSVQRRRLKSWLNSEVASEMTFAELQAQDSGNEILGWLQEIDSLLS